MRLPNSVSKILLLSAVLLKGRTDHDPASHMEGRGSHHCGGTPRAGGGARELRRLRLVLVVLGCCLGELEFG